MAPGVDETPQPGELPIDLVHRLARSKAEAIARQQLDALVIGSDQLAAHGRDVLGKPGSPQGAIEQLRALSGQRVTFYTAAHVIRSDTGANEGVLDVTTVQFRVLSEAEIERYVSKERAFDCAGGFKIESLGVALFERVESNDPTALIGLPLIWLSGALRRNGFHAP